MLLWSHSYNQLLVSYGNISAAWEDFYDSHKFPMLAISLLTPNRQEKFITFISSQEGMFFYTFLMICFYRVSTLSELVILHSSYRIFIPSRMIKLSWNFMVSSTPSCLSILLIKLFLLWYHIFFIHCSSRLHRVNQKVLTFQTLKNQ